MLDYHAIKINQYRRLRELDQVEIDQLIMLTKFLRTNRC